jgi:hypothetical protein
MFGEGSITLGGLIIGGGAVVGLVTAVIAVVRAAQATTEYLRRGSIDRTKQFFELRGRLRKERIFNNICDILEQNRDSEELLDIPFEDKDAFIAFFHEVFLLWNSNLMNAEVVYYMFGYYAIKCANSNTFWRGRDYEKMNESPYYKLFFTFVQRLQQYVPDENKYAPNPALFKL